MKNEKKVITIVGKKGKGMSITQPWTDAQLPIYRCIHCGHIQAYIGKGDPHCGMCTAFLSVIDIIDVIKKPE